METTERIVEAYARYVKGCFTLPNVRCDGQREIDLLAVNVQSSRVAKRYHIESGVSISGPFSRLTNRPFSQSELRIRVRQAAQRRTLGYFEERKFDATAVLSNLAQFGFRPGNYTKVIVTWGWENDVEGAAATKGIALWDFRNILIEMSQACHGRRTYFTDDTMRTLDVMTKALEHASRRTSKATKGREEQRSRRGQAPHRSIAQTTTRSR